MEPEASREFRSMVNELLEACEILVIHEICMLLVEPFT